MKKGSAVQIFKILCETEDLEGMKEMVPFLPPTQDKSWDEYASKPLSLLYTELGETGNWEFAKKAVEVLAKAQYSILDGNYVELTSDEEDVEKPSFPLIELIVAYEKQGVTNKEGYTALAYCLTGNAFHPSWLEAIADQGIDLLHYGQDKHKQSIFSICANPTIWFVDEVLSRWVDQSIYLLQRFSKLPEPDKEKSIEQIQEGFSSMFTRIAEEYHFDLTQDTTCPEYLQFIAPVQTQLDHLKLQAETPTVTRKRRQPRL